MNERELFLAAIEIDDPAARLTFLQQQCGVDTELLVKVQSLLTSHERESQFLNTPVIDQLAGDGEKRVIVGLLPPSGRVAGSFLAPSEERAGGEGSCARRASEAHAETSDNVASGIPFGFLQPSSRPDSLGRVAHYEVLEVLGRGAFGTVLKAFDENLQRVVAIKVLAPDFAATSPARKRFLGEARNSAAIRHENVISIYAVEQVPTPYLVMEFVPGQTLQQRLDQHGPLDLPDVLRIGKQIAYGLAAAHAEQLIHRDVKPGNILLDTSIHDRVKITDFGLSRAVDDASMTQSGLIAGTPLYMAPEQALGRKLDQRADLFSLGSVLYQAISGRPPFRAPSTLAVLKRVTEDTPRPIQEIVPEVPDWFCAIIQKLHAKNPEDRYGSAKEVGDLLEKCLADLELGRIPSVAVAGARPRGRTGSWFLASAAVVLLFLVILAITEVTGFTNFAGSGLDRRPNPMPVDRPALQNADVELESVLPPTEFPELKRLVDLARDDWQDAQNRYLAQASSAMEVSDAELRWIEAELKLAEATQQPEAQRRALLDRMVGQYQLRFDVAKRLVEAGNIPTSELRNAERELLEAKQRWATARSLGATPAAQLDRSESSWIPLFNGRDLAGWKSHPDQPSQWRVEQGVLVSSGQPSYLFSERDDFTDIELRCEVSISRGGDGGIFVRTPFQLAGENGLPGYEAQIQSGRLLASGWATGAIGQTDARSGWQMKRPASTTVPEDIFFPLVVKMVGNRIETYVYGAMVAEYEDVYRTYQRGHLALQHSGQDTRIAFRKIEIHEFDPESAAER